MFWIIFKVTEVDQTLMRIELRLSVLHDNADPHIGVQQMFTAVDGGDLFFALHTI